VGEGVRDAGGDLWHACQQGRAPGRRQHVNLGVGPLSAQPHEQRLHHEGIADPGRRNDQQLVDDAPQW